MFELILEWIYTLGLLKWEKNCKKDMNFEGPRRECYELDYVPHKVHIKVIIFGNSASEKVIKIKYFHLEGHST